MNKYYTGIGSRETPENILNYMTYLASELEKRKYILRSGGADGADSAFEDGVQEFYMAEIYLPWRNFNNNNSPLYNISDEAMSMAKKYHPRWNHLSQGAKKLHSRNCYQVLGYYLTIPSNFIICWTKDGKVSGGTGQALRIAIDNDIPIYNLYNKIYKIEEIINK